MKPDVTDPDPIIDKSLVQQQLRFDKMRAELLEMGYSVVRTVWLHENLDYHRPDHKPMEKVQCPS